MPPIQLKSTQHVVGNQGIKVAVYGQAGAGKTMLCASAPNPVILSAESGLMSLRQYNLPYITVGSYQSLNEAFEWCMKSAEAKQFDTICLDSFSEIGEVVLGDLKKKSKDPRQAYGQVQEDMIGMLRSFRDMAEKNVYFSVKEERIKDGHTGAVIMGPMMPGNKLPQQIPYFFDELFQLFVYSDPQTKEQTRALRTQGDNQYIAKDRSGALNFWEPCDLTHIFNKIKGS